LLDSTIEIDKTYKTERRFIEFSDADLLIIANKKIMLSNPNEEICTLYIAHKEEEIDLDQNQIKQNKEITITNSNREVLLKIEKAFQEVKLELIVIKQLEKNVLEVVATLQEKLKILVK
jgi:hypothetical protein